MNYFDCFNELDLYVILIGQGQIFTFKLSDVSRKYGSKVVFVLNKIKKLKGQ